MKEGKKERDRERIKLMDESSNVRNIIRKSTTIVYGIRGHSTSTRLSRRRQQSVT
jgi:hypothetical protein